MSSGARPVINAVGTFRDFLTNVNKEFVVNYLNKPSTGEEESILLGILRVGPFSGSSISTSGTSLGTPRGLRSG